MPTLTRRRVLSAALAAGLGAAALPAFRAGERVAVVGGGPAGAEAAVALAARRPAGSVLLVERDPTRLTRAAAGAFGRPEAGPDLAALRRAGVEVLVDEADGVDFAERRLVLGSGRRIAWDRLVLAPGAAAMEEGIAGLDAAARHRWPAAWGDAREGRRLAAQLAALPARGHVVLRLPPAEPGDDARHLARALELAGRLAATGARLTILDSAPGRDLGPRFAAQAAAGRLGSRARWLPADRGGTVLSVDAGRGRIETAAGPLVVDAANFIPRQGAGRIARLAGLADAGGWCPCDAQGRSTLAPRVSILGDARRGAERSLAGALASARPA